MPAHSVNEKRQKMKKNICYYGLDEALVKYKDTEYIELLEKWLPNYFNRALKTDLYEESFGSTSIFHCIKRKTAHVTGIDISPAVVNNAMFEICKTSIRSYGNELRINFVVSDIRTTAFKDNSYDLIVSTSTLDHFREIELALKELHRILKDNGVAVLTLHNKHNPFLAFYFFILSIFNNNKSEKNVLYYFPQAKSLLKNANFIIIDSAFIVNIFPLTPTAIKILRKIRSNFSSNLINKIIFFLRKFGRGRDRSASAWFIGFLIKKN